eukprot:SAG22_NODE_80_length_21788_cov_9.742542_6_plen_47_part_00
MIRCLLLAAAALSLAQLGAEAISVAAAPPAAPRRRLAEDGLHLKHS